MLPRGDKIGVGMFAAARPIHDIAALNTRLFENNLQGVDDFIARRRIHARVNNIAFVALHLVGARTYLGRYLGLDLEDPFEEQTANVDTIEQMTSFPLLERLRETWTEASAVVLEHIETLPEDQWAQPSRIEFPVAGKTVLEGAAFLLHHESYHLGQLGLLRKHAGLPAMSYS